MLTKYKGIYWRTSICNSITTLSSESPSLLQSSSPSLPHRPHPVGSSVIFLQPESLLPPTPSPPSQLRASALLDTLLHIRIILLPALESCQPKIGKHIVFILPITGHIAHNDTVSTIPIPIEFPHVRDNLCP